MKEQLLALVEKIREAYARNDCETAQDYEGELLYGFGYMAAVGAPREVQEVGGAISELAREEGLSFEWK